MRRGRRGPTRAKSDASADDLIQEIRQKRMASSNYRDRSLAIHGLVCARCARSFDHTNRQLLTVHHKDGNHDNNPPDGSNWENLCAYCHDDEHSRKLLGSYYSEEG